MITIQITDETIANALQIHWLRANRGSLTWGEVMDDIDSMQNLLLYSGIDLESSEYDDLRFLWSHALSRI